ncbi:MAG: ABC transporter permease [Chloroflexi bacterium]|nr:ABC transporter permease [Chloroflexota bacterium]
MVAFMVRRLLETLIVLVIVSFVAFSLLHLTPGDPARVILGDSATQAQIDALRQELWLDQPLWVQYAHWAGNFMRGDLGTSIFYRDSVTTLIATRLPATFYLGLVAFLISVAVGIPAGVICAVRRGGWLDSVITVSANLAMAVPIFWLGILCIYLFALTLGWLPVQGYTSPFDNLELSLRQLLMPAACLAIVPLASITRQTRSSMLEVIRQDYIRTARAKGLSDWGVIAGHALKNALVPVVTLLGMDLRNLVGGSVLVEQVFNIPGMGRLMVSGIFDRDYVIVQGIVMVVGAVVVLANLLVDISYGYIDPRIRFDE